MIQRARASDAPPRLNRAGDDAAHKRDRVRFPDDTPPDRRPIAARADRTTRDPCRPLSKRRASR